MHLLTILASPNDHSNSAFLAKHFSDVFREQGVTVTVLNLRDLAIDPFTLRHYDPKYSHEQDFLTVQEAMQSCDGLLIATPVWNFGVPAVLKNLIDRLGSFALDSETRSKGQLKGLPFFLLFTGGAPAPAWKGLMKKTTSFVAQGLQYFGASSLGYHFEPTCTLGRGKFGLIVDQRPESIAVVRAKAKEFFCVVQAYKETGKPPLKNSIRACVMRWGEGILKKLG